MKRLMRTVVLQNRVLCRVQDGNPRHPDKNDKNPGHKFCTSRRARQKPTYRQTLWTTSRSRQTLWTTSRSRRSPWDNKSLPAKALDIKSFPAKASDNKSFPTIGPRGFRKAPEVPGSCFQNSCRTVVSRPPGLAASNLAASSLAASSFAASSLAASSLAASSFAASSLATSSLAGGSAPKASLMLWGRSLRCIRGGASVAKTCIGFGAEPIVRFQDPTSALAIVIWSICRWLVNSVFWVCCLLCFLCFSFWGFLLVLCCGFVFVVCSYFWFVVCFVCCVFVSGDTTLPGSPLTCDPRVTTL
jgi:hypothetical protein